MHEHVPPEHDPTAVRTGASLRPQTAPLGLTVPAHSPSACMGVPLLCWSVAERAARHAALGAVLREEVLREEVSTMGRLIALDVLQPAAPVPSQIALLAPLSKSGRSGDSAWIRRATDVGGIEQPPMPADTSGRDGQGRAVFAPHSDLSPVPAQHGLWGGGSSATEGVRGLRPPDTRPGA